MLKLYCAPLTRSNRILWLLKELALPHTLECVAFNAGTGRQPTPSGLFPVIEDGGVVVAESGAIVEYLLERYGEGRLAPPVGSPDRGRYLEWPHAVEATIAPPINVFVGLSRYRDDAEKNRDVIEIFRSSAQAKFDRVEAALGDDAYIVGGAFTAADVMLGFTLWSARMLWLLTPAHPRTTAYVARLTARPAFAEALAESRRGA